jgi:hypothetical protein
MESQCNSNGITHHSLWACIAWLIGANIFQSIDNCKVRKPHANFILLSQVKKTPSAY